MSAHKRPESVLVLVYTAAGQVLMLRRRQPKDFWQSVTGSLEWGESAQSAAARELQEETGLPGLNLIDCTQSQSFEIYPFFRHRYAPGVTSNVEHVFRLQVEADTPVRLDPAEHTEYRWLPKPAATALATSHTNRDAILSWVPEPATPHA